jgi:hypothetical protein
MANLTRRWTTNDIEKLRRFAGKLPPAAIAAELGRTRGSLAVKAHELKISLRVEARPSSDKPASDSNENSAGFNVS